MTSSPTGGWAFAGHTFQDRAVLSGLEQKRMAAYEAAADAEAVMQSAVNPYDRVELAKDRERWYQEATRIEAEIHRISSQGLNTDMEDDGAE